MYNEFYDRYEIIRELSCSRHSKVYLVRHRILDVYRVAKIFSGNQYEADRLLKEAHLIKNLKHPHIPVIYDIEQNIGEDNSSICIIEEYIDGKSLRQYVNDETGTRKYYRIYEFIENAVSYDQSQDKEIVYNTGKAFGNFQRLLGYYPLS